MDYKLIFDNAEREYCVHLGVTDRFLLKKLLENIPCRNQEYRQVSCYIRRLLLEFGYNSKRLNIIDKDVKKNEKRNAKEALKRGHY